MDPKKETNEIRCLLVESNSGDAEALVQNLMCSESTGFRVSRVGTLADALESFNDQVWDVILLNISLSDSGGLHSLEKLQKHQIDAPIVIVNAPDDESLAVKCVNIGAQSYLIKTQIGTKGLSREIKMAVSRYNYSKSHHHELRQNAVSDLARDLNENLSKPFISIRENVTALKHMVAEPDFSCDKALSLLEETELISKDFMALISELKMLAEDTSQTESDIQLAKKKARFLVVDDEPDIVNMLVRRLRRLGYDNIDTASNGQEAYSRCLDRLQKGIKYDSIISDWNMPELSGLELLSKIRRNANLATTPFMMLTAVDEVSHVKKAVDEKVSQYLVKPFKPEEFDRKIAHLLRKI